MVEYLTFSESVTNLQDLLNKYSKNGWSLVTCQITPTYGPNGTGHPNATVIMEKQEWTKEEEDTDEEPKAEAMPMKG